MTGQIELRKKNRFTEPTMLKATDNKVDWVSFSKGLLKSLLSIVFPTFEFGQ